MAKKTKTKTKEKVFEIENAFRDETTTAVIVKNPSGLKAAKERKYRAMAEINRVSDMESQIAELKLMVEELASNK